MLKPPHLKLSRKVACPLFCLIGIMAFLGILFPPMTDTLGNAQHGDPIKAVFLTYNFPVYPNLTHLCQQRVYTLGQGTKHITWDAFASEDVLSSIIEYYTKLLGIDGFSQEEHGGTWRFPKEKPERVLSIIPVEAEGPHRSCDRTPPAQTQSIIIISTTH